MDAKDIGMMYVHVKRDALERHKEVATKATIYLQIKSVQSFFMCALNSTQCRRSLPPLHECSYLSIVKIIMLTSVINGNHSHYG